MLRFTPAELELAVVTLIGAFTAFAAMTAWLFWQQGRDMARLWDTVHDDQPADEQPEDQADPLPVDPPTAPIPLGTDTAEADPADTFARQEHVLARAGRHRA